MKKLLTAILITIISVMAFTACAPDLMIGDEPDQPDVVDVDIDDDDPYEYDPAEIEHETLNATYSLSDIVYTDPETGEWVSMEFIPGSEKYVFHDDDSCEYIYKNYPSYDDMLADSNYEMVTQEGFYVFNSEESGVSMMFDSMPAFATIDGDQLIVEYPYGEYALRSIYTLEG